MTLVTLCHMNRWTDGDFIMQGFSPACYQSHSPRPRIIGVPCGHTLVQDTAQNGEQVVYCDDPVLLWKRSPAMVYEYMFYTTIPDEKQSVKPKIGAEPKPTSLLCSCVLYFSSPKLSSTSMITTAGYLCFSTRHCHINGRHAPGKSKRVRKVLTTLVKNRKTLWGEKMFEKGEKVTEKLRPYPGGACWEKTFQSCSNCSNFVPNVPILFPIQENRTTDDCQSCDHSCFISCHRSSR